MQTSLLALLTIFGMALVTYLTRMSGLWLMSHITLSTRMKAWLGYLPGTVIVAIVALTVLCAVLVPAALVRLSVVAPARTPKVPLAVILDCVVALRLPML